MMRSVTFAKRRFLEKKVHRLLTNFPVGDPVGCGDLAALRMEEEKLLLFAVCWMQLIDDKER